MEDQVYWEHIKKPVFDRPDFQEWPSIARLSREMVITEKLDGSNSSICVTEAGNVYAGSRSRWITPEDDNFGFARWVKEHEIGLAAELGVGLHFGEWWGKGIQRGYGLQEKRFSLFNTTRWKDQVLSFCHVVPILYEGIFDTQIIDDVLESLRREGSSAAPSFMSAEGVVIFHTKSNTMYKKTLDKNDLGKWSTAPLDSRA